jgi:hypothetical protein
MRAAKFSLLYHGYNRHEGVLPVTCNRKVTNNLEYMVDGEHFSRFHTQILVDGQATVFNVIFQSNVVA